MPGGDELVGGAAEGDRIAARERARLHERRDDHVLDAILCLLQGHPGRRRHLHRDRTLPLAVEDLLGAAGKLANLRHALQRHELAAGRNHRQRAHVLRAVHEPFISLDDEVDAIAAEVMVGGVAAIDEAVDHVAELPGVERHVGRLLQPRHELDLGAREIERRLRQVLAARGRLRQLAHDLHAELYFLLFSGRDHDRRGGGGGRSGRCARRRREEQGGEAGESRHEKTMDGARDHSAVYTLACDRNRREMLFSARIFQPLDAHPGLR